MTPCSDVSSILAILRRVTAPPGPERNLAESVERALAAAGVEFRRESRLSTGRVDLRIGPTAIELKVGGTSKAVLGQLARYGRDPSVTSVVLVTTSAKHKAEIPSEVEGKPIHVVWLPRL